MGSSFGGKADSVSLEQKGEESPLDEAWKLSESLWLTKIIQVKARKNRKDNTEKNFAPKVTENSIFVEETHLYSLL